MTDSGEIRFSSEEEAQEFLSNLCAEKDYSYIAGLDEVGRGPFAGPVVAACVLLPLNHGIKGIKDSKKLSAKKRQRLAEEIREKAHWSLGVRTSNQIDDLNIRVATFQAAAEAAISCTYKGAPIDLLLCDGGLFLDSLVPFPTISVVKGDLWFEAIGAASIIAKVYRDDLMLQYHEKWSEYKFNTNKGYGTKQHIEAILEYGITPIHRKTFGICKKAKDREDG